MLAKITSKNQLTLPRRITQAVGQAEYFDVQARDGRIVLTPVRIVQADAVRDKLEELGIGEADIADAVNWARGRAPMSEPAPCTQRPSRSKSSKSSKTSKAGTTGKTERPGKAA